MQAALTDRYSIVRELGRGATATVYLAQDLKHKNLVAIKVLAEEFALAVRIADFQREIETAARLTHPHILQVHASGPAAGLLYYVMAYIDGGSVADRLSRDGPLPVDDAVRITREVADALDYAHGQGVIHRDIKPGNILLSAGHAWVADFGIARAMEAGETGRTATGALLGTPAYMSPEQVTGDHRLDGRTDVYSLGCVLYEMLVGVDPFHGPDVQSTMTRRVVEPPPHVRAVRPDVPAWLEQVSLVALATKAADRFPTARAFGEALAQKGTELVLPPRPVSDPTPWRPLRRALAAMVPAGLVLAAVALWGRSSVALDATYYAVFPPEGDTTAPAAQFGEALLRDALGAWDGITMVERRKVHEALERRGRRPLDTRGALAVARSLEAGRYLRTEVSPFGDSTRVHVTLYDATGDGAVVREVTIKLGPGLVGATSTYAALVDQMLFGPGAEPTGTHAYPARLAFERGRAAVQEWELEEADSAFVEATAADATYAQAHVWLAQVRFWKGAETPTWRSPAERASAGRSRLGQRDRMLSDALVAFGRGNIVRACATWGVLTESAPHDFSGWYGLANCLSRDDAVLRDPGSPSGWRFRTSYHQATRAYQHAFQLQPSIHRSLRRGSYEFVRRLLLTSGNMVRFGHGLPPSTRRFAAYPAWRADTLTLIPQPLEVLGGPHEMPKTMGIAIRRERELFHEIATAWVTAFPNSAAAVEALAISLDMLADPTAVDTLRRARTLVSTPEERFQVAGAEAWMRARYAIPHDLSGMRAARALADSLLRAYATSGSTEPLLVASLAALTGRVHLAAALTRNHRVVNLWNVPAPLASAAGPLFVFAAFGGPVDSLRALEEQIKAAIDKEPVVATRRRMQMQWLGRPAQLAFPSHRFTSLPALAGVGDYMIDAEVAFLRGDTAAVRRMFADLTLTRRNASPADVMPEGLYPEAWLLAEAGDPRAAIAWLEPTLAALSATAPEKLIDPANAGALVQAIVLRADLADRAGDEASAARWSRVVSVFWEHADPPLQPLVQRMRRMTESRHIPNAANPNNE